MSEKNVRIAVFPVGGLGTRFLPATKAMPKEMLPVVDKPLIQYAYEEARDSGIEQFIFVTGRNKGVISDHFDHAYELQQTLKGDNKEDLLSLARDWLPDAGNIAFIRQQEPLGLGHAVLCAKNYVGNQPFAVLLADELVDAKVPFLKQLMNYYSTTGGNVVGVTGIEAEQSTSYGIVDVEEDKGELVSMKGLVEKPQPADAPSNLAVTGRYILQPEIFDVLEGTGKGSGGEVQLTDAIAAMIGDVPTHAVKMQGRRFDCGSKAGFVEATIAYALNDPKLKARTQALLKEYSQRCD